MTARGRLSAVVVVAALLVLAASESRAYPRPSWRDEDHDCQSTRTEVLVKTCRVKLSPSRCKVVQATCLDLYSGAEVASDTPAQTFHVDHIFPAAEAWKRRTWTADEFADFFNDQGNLLVTRARTNLRKGDRMPQEWCPASRGARMLVARRLRRTAAVYGLKVSSEEQAGVRSWERGECAPGAVVL